MKLAVLPFNAAEGTPPALARQLSNFASDTVRASAGAEINSVSFLTQVEQNGAQRSALVNIAEGLLERNWIDDLFKQAGVDEVLDGMLKQTGDQSYSLTVRFHRPDKDTPIFEETYDFTNDGLFPILRTLIGSIADHCEVKMPEGSEAETLDFGTDDPAAFLHFLEGYDALLYIQQANGLVVEEFSPIPAIESLTQAAEADPEFDGPYQALIALCRACAANRLGTFEVIEGALKKLIDLHPEDFTAYFGLGEVYQSVGDAGRAAEYYEKAVQRRPDDPALYVRLGLSQIGSGMPVNAERNFRKALDLEGDDKPSTDFLANVLVQTNRGHEVPALWKQLVDTNPQNGQAHAKYGISLLQADRQEEGERAFEQGLELLEDNSIVKRFYAPVLAQKGELDRAMDFYEDVLDVAPNDVEVLLEYAKTLQSAGREFEIPRILKDVLASTQDPNVRAQATGWLIELEQPKRVESVENARAKMEAGDFEGAVRDLKPLRNWLGDYWKLWAMLAAAFNRLGDAAEAEIAARKLLEMFPACEPAYGELVSALNALGRHDEAYQLMRFAAANMPQSLPIHVNLAIAADRAGHRDEAKALARQIREAVGPNEELEPVLAQIER